MRKKIIISVGCSVSALSLLLAGCSGNTTNGDSTNTTGAVTSANAESVDSNTTSNSGDIPYIDIRRIALKDKKAGLFQAETVLFNIDGEIVENNIKDTCEAEVNIIKEKVYGNTPNIKYYMYDDFDVYSSNPNFYDGQRLYSVFTNASELSGNTLKASIINNNGKVVFESVIEGSIDECTLLNKVFGFDFPYFQFNNGKKIQCYKIVGESSELVSEVPVGTSFWSDGFYMYYDHEDKSKNAVYNPNGEKIIDVGFSDIEHNTSSGCFLQVINDSHDIYESSKLYDSNGVLLLDPSTLDIGSAEIVCASFLKGENTEGLVRLELENVNGSNFWGIIDKNGKWILEPSNAENVEGISEKVGDYYISSHCILDKDLNIIANIGDKYSFEDKIVFKEDYSIKRLDTSTGEIKTLFYGY